VLGAPIPMTDVLLVEDELLIAEVVEDALREAGLAVAARHTARDASACLEAEARSFTVLLTDINLGAELDGFDLAARARALNPKLKVVYVTGHPSNLARAWGEDALVFAKPFDPTRLAGAVARLVSVD
jgi:DNA-binding NtrC family response regulator